MTRAQLEALAARVEAAQGADRELPPLHRGAPVDCGALAPWKVVEIALAKGEFRVSWRYRDARLVRRCSKLRRQGWLRQVRCAPGEYLFKPTAAALRARAMEAPDAE